MHMSYCRFENTLIDLRDCANVIEAKVSGDREEGTLSFSERQALIGMIHLMGNMLEALGASVDDIKIATDLANEF